MQTWQLGDTRITRIEEIIGPLFDPVRFFPAYNAETINRHRDWLYPNHMIEGGNIIASMHAWLIQTPGYNILVDSCLGNDKNRMPYRNWHQMKTPFMSRFASTGITPDDIDYVLCTHLHVDHVGWNTRLENGQWVPTFPNARYLFSKVEFEFWQAQRQAPNPDEFNSVNHQTFDDSVMPILHIADLIQGQHEVLADRLVINPAPGHTPGSITVSLRSDRQEAIFTGDITHHPLQVYEPDWNSAFCELPDQAIATRYDVLSHCADHGSLMMPAHFGPGHAGYVRSHDRGYRFEFTAG